MRNENRYSESLRRKNSISSEETGIVKTEEVAEDAAEEGAGRARAAKAEV